jgi:hypothetical protein
MQNHKIANNSTTIQAREKNTDLDSLEFLKYFDVCLAKSTNDPTLFDKIGYQFLVMTKLFI